MTAILVHIQGRVQGIGFRAWTERQAQALDLDGWVRNEPDGAVRALVSGPDDAVARMLALLRGGPRHASVASLTSEPAGTAAIPQGFRQIR